MRRILASLQYDFLRQARYGLIAVGVLMILFWGVILGFLLDGTEAVARSAAPAFLAMNTIITTFYFMAALVLFERSENTLAALIVTPLRHGEYLASKGVSLAVLALVENVAVIVLLFGMNFNWGWLIPAGFILGLLYSWMGFLVVINFDSINTFLLPSAALVLLLSLPLLSHFGMTSRWAFGWHPVEPALTLMRSAYDPASMGELAYGIAALAGWTLAAFQLARRRLTAFVSEGSE